MPSTSIDARTQLVGLIGWPVEHSVSPAMQNAGFSSLGLNWRYVPLPVPPGQIESAVRGLGALGFRGANVTVPHKQAVIRTLDVIAPDAKHLGAINTITVKRDKEGIIRTSGHNTDAAGFRRALQDGGFRPEGTSAVVIGAGGGARAIVFGLLKSSVGEILILNRTLERAQALVSDLERQSSSTLRASPLSPETLVESARAADLLVHATPIGMWPQVEASAWPDGVPVPPHLTVFDLVYNPLETKLLRQARTSNAQTIGGLRMLVHQGTLAFELWTGRRPPVEVMDSACIQALSDLG